MAKDVITEAAEVCPHCEAENVYPDWDVDAKGFVATCHECGSEIFLCDECLHADDNPAGKCDWRQGRDEAGREYGVCFRGMTAGKEGA